MTTILVDVNNDELSPDQTVYHRSFGAGTYVGPVSQAKGLYAARVFYEGDGRSRTIRPWLLSSAPFEDVVHGQAVDTDTDDGVTREEILELELKQLKSRLTQSRKSDVNAERVLGYIADAVTAAPVKWEPAPYVASSGHEHVHDLFLSDWHYGEVVDSEQVDGLNEFNVDVLTRRVEDVYNSVLSFKEHRTYPINELHIALGGDMASGGPGIHDEIREANERTAAEQGIGVGHLIADLIERLVPHYSKIVVSGVSGNHPRMAKPHASKNVFDNFDWMAYKLAEARLSQYPSIEFNIPRSGLVVQEIAGRNILLFHGDGIRSTMPGVPWGGVMRRANELKKQWLDRGLRLDGFKLGHFHQPNVVAGPIWMNGSLVGINEYGLKNFGSGSAPCQLLTTWDATNGRPVDVSYITPQ